MDCIFLICSNMFKSEYRCPQVSYFWESFKIHTAGQVRSTGHEGKGQCCRASGTGCHEHAVPCRADSGSVLCGWHQVSAPWRQGTGVPGGRSCSIYHHLASTATASHRAVWHTGCCRGLPTAAAQWHHALLPCNNHGTCFSMITCMDNRSVLWLFII